MSNKPDPQVLETAIAAASNAHTSLHQAINELRLNKRHRAKRDNLYALG
ncbi:hypothetical protein [Nostoc sp. FACHB-888]|nr:hypothetical protein [Nostoc sp. FACHB-888]MBD2245160.1 hypothetical protein [Nostoc sp. FACHB-888]